MTNWPPLYSGLVAMLLLVTNNNYELSCLLIDLLAGILSIWILTLILKRCQFPYWLIGLLIVWKSAIVTDYVVRSSPTDLLACNALLATIYFALKYYAKPSKWILVVLTILNLVAPFLKYLYVHIAFIIPFVFIINGVAKKNRGVFRAGLTIGVVSLIAIVALFTFNKIISGNLYESPPTEHGFFPENLKHIYPVFWESFFGVDFAGTQLNLRFGINYTAFYRFLSYSGFLLLICVLGYLFYKFASRKFFLQDSFKANFFLVGGLTSVGILITLLYLALTTHIHLLPPVDVIWTYLMQPRYFLFIQYFVFIYISWLLFLKLKNRFVKPSVILLIIFAVIEILHAIYSFRNGVNSAKESNLNAIESKTITNYIDSVYNASENNGTELIIVSPDYGFIGYGVINNIKVIKDTYELKGISNKRESPVLLLLIKQSNSIKGFENFVVENKLPVARSILGTSFYHFQLEPE